MPIPVTMPADGESFPYMSKAASARELEKVRTGIDQPFDALARGELVAPPMLFDRLGAAAGAHGDEPLAQLGD